MIELFYTYIHRRNSDNKIFYVGKGHGLRLRKKDNRNKKWHAVVNEHGFTPEVVSTFLTHDEAYEHERFLIWCFRDMGFDLVNISSGGRGRDSPGKPHSEDHKKMMSDRHSGKNNPMFGKKHPPEILEKIRRSSTGVCRMSDATKKRMSEERMGVKRPDSVGEKIRLARTGTKASEETKAKMRASQAKRFLREKQNDA
jgi:group I intron endonuclease